MKWLLLFAIGALLSACAIRTGHHDVELTVPMVRIDVRPEHRNRTHLTGYEVRRGTRHCYYSNGAATQMHHSQACPLVY